MTQRTDSPGLRLRRALSLTVGWLADRRVPGPLRAPIYSAYARATGARLAEAQLPLAAYPSLGAFFVRRLRPGAREIDGTPNRLVSPCDGRVQAMDRVERGSILQAKGRPYPLEELLGGVDDDLEGAWAITIYLGPSDYHRVHAPVDCRLSEVRWIPGDRFSVAQKVVARRPRLLSINERAVLRLETDHGPLLLVMVGALNVGRIRVVGVEPGSSPRKPPSFVRGAELARFEMGSTVVLILPPHRATPSDSLALDDGVRLGQAIAALHPRPAARTEAFPRSTT